MAKKCEFCGKRGRRFCPAINNEICSLCCANRRMAEIDCKQDCEHNPFGTKALTKFRELHSNFLIFSMRYLSDYYSRPERELAYEAFNNPMEIGEEEKMYFFCREKLYREPQSDGRTIFEIWQENGFKPLNHDQKLLLEYKKSQFPSVIEFQKKIDDNFAEFVDILDPEHKSFKIMDPVFIANDYPRFTRIFTFIEIYPNFCRFGRDGGLELPGAISNMFIEKLKEESRIANISPKEYLVKNYEECTSWPMKLHEQYRKDFTARTEHKIYTVKYDIANNCNKIIDGLLSRNDMEEDRDPENRPCCRYFSWVQRGVSFDFDGSKDTIMEYMTDSNNEEQLLVIGSIAVFNNYLELEAKSSNKYSFARQRLEKDFGRMIKFQSEDIVDVGRELMYEDTEKYIDGLADRNKNPHGNEIEEEWLEDDEEFYYYEEDGEPHVPLDIQQHLIHKASDKHYRNFINHKIPLLDNITPKEASRDASMRPKLVDLMKDHIRGDIEQSKEKGIEPYDFTWLLDELNLPELK